jgi:hypothetical protein
MSRRNVATDLLWGLRVGLGVTSLVFVPVLLAVLLNPGEWPTLGKMFLAYLMFGGVAGIFAGLSRPVLRRQHGAIAVGCAVGIAGFLTILLVSNGPRQYPLLTGVMVTATLGGLVGSFMGWWILRRVKYWERLVQNTRQR